MPIPDFQKTFLPFMTELADGKEKSMNEIIERIALHFELTDEERKRMFPSGNAVIYKNRIRFARLYLIKAGLIESQKRGYVNITKDGKKAMLQNPSEMNLKYLEQFPLFQKFKEEQRKKQEQKRKESGNDVIEERFETPLSSLETDQTTQETLEYAYQAIREQSISDILDKVAECSWEFFEKLVIDLLLKIGYGGSRKDAGKAFAKSNDEGIDGIIKEDKLGLDIIYVQAKKWRNVVGRPEIQKFAGALQGKRAKKGIFITTSRFTNNAHEYVKLIDSKIVLIDGDELASLMLDYNLGVSVKAIYELKDIDTDYFLEE